MSLPVSIDSIKSTINRRGGVARGNRYAVYVSHPSKGMNSLLKFDPATLLNNMISGDGIHIGDFISDPRDTYMLCTGVSLPGKRIATTEAAHNHHMAKKPYSMMTDEVNMTFLLTNDYYVKKYFDMWQEMVIDSTHEHYKAFYKRDYCMDVTIQQLSTSNDIIPGYTVQLENAYPIQVGAVELGNANEGLLEVSITWEYDNWRSVGFIDGIQDVFGSLLDRLKATKIKTSAASSPKTEQLNLEKLAADKRRFAALGGGQIS